MSHQTSTQGSVLRFFAEGNTARGSVNLFESSLQNLDKLYILKGGPGNGKSNLIRSISEGLQEKGYDIWLLHCARDHQSLDGLIVPHLKLGIVDGTAPHVVEPRLPGVVEVYMNLGDAWNLHVLSRYRAEIERLTGSIDDLYARAYAGFAEALRVHDEWEAIYIANMDFAAADQLTQRCIQMLFGDQKMERKARIDHRFLGAATADGAVDFVPNLTVGLRKRYFIKGRPGSGKSTMLKKLANAAAERGFDVEIYHCGFDPHSVDMVIVRELGFAIFDSTKPHEYDPERSGDAIIDMYESCINPDTDAHYADQLQDIEARYAAAMKRAIGLLREAHKQHQELEQIYTQATDFSLISLMKDQIELEIQDLISGGNLGE